MVQAQLPSFEQFFSGGLLLQVILMALYRLIPNPFGILNVFAITIQSSLALAVFIYSKKVAEMKPWIAFLAAIAFSFNLLALRLTWDQYRISLSLVFIIIAFIFLRSKSARIRYATVPLTMIASLFNPLPVALFIPCVIIDLAFNHKEISKFIASSASIIMGLFLIFIQYATQSVLSGADFLSEPLRGPQGLIDSLGYLFYGSWPLLVFIPLQFAKRQKGLELYWLYVIVFFAMIAPLVGVYTISSYWILWLSGFSLSIIFGETLTLYQNSKIVKIIGAILIISMVTGSLIYVSSSPANPKYFPSLANAYKGNSPSGYLVSTVDISQESGLVRILNSSIMTLPARSSFLLPQDFYGLALTLPNPNGLDLIQVGATFLTNLQDYNGSKGDYILWFIGPVPHGFQVMWNNTYFVLYLIQ
jgi:hypothetical protein